MSNTDKLSNTETHLAQMPALNPNPELSPSRRRLIKLGTTAVPIIATLASRPALAWHCKTPSAWGSEYLNPNTSLKNNAGHASYGDETWACSNWRDNTARSETGNASLPWAALLGSYGTLYDTTTKTWDSKKKKYFFDYTLVTIQKLNTVTLVNCASASLTATVKTVLTSGTEIQKRTICAQLNYLLLPSLGQCLPMTELKNMASYGANGTYQPAGLSGAWPTDKVLSFLKNNYMALLTPTELG